MLGWNLQRGRCHEDSPAATPVSPSRKGFYAIGAPGDGTPYCWFYGRAGTGNFIGFPRHLYEEMYCRLVIFPGNAPCHKPGALQGFLDGMSGEIRICHFPPHAPDPAEGRWRPFRRAAGNRPHGGAGVMQGSINAVLRGKGVPIVKTYGYPAY